MPGASAWLSHEALLVVATGMDDQDVATRATRDDRPGRLRPECHRSRAADLPVADPDKLIPVADPGGGDVEQDLVCGTRRQFVHLEDLDGLAACRVPTTRILFDTR
jgi:hypothetical protein